MKNAWKGLAAIAVSAAIVVAPLTLAGANATSGEPNPTCTPSEAYIEDVPDIIHPAVYKTVEVTPATEGIAAVWANFSPNDQQATFVGPAVYPNDERGTWHDHGQLPPGQAGPDGVYYNGNPAKGGDWFYRHAAVPGTPAVTEERLVTAEWTEVTEDIEHEAVTCDDEPQIVSEWVTWETPQWFPGLNGHVSAPSNAFPQDFVAVGQVAPTDCETTYQQDLYVGTQAEIDAVLADGVLTGPPNPYEDGSIVEDWTFVSTDACPTPPDDELIPIPAQFSFPPSAPDCDTDGALPTFDGSQFPNVTWQIDPEFTGPGEYVLTVFPKEGFAFDESNLPAGWGYEPATGAVSRVLTVNGALGFQNTNPNAPCFLATPVPVTLGQPTSTDACGTDNDSAALPADQEGVTYAWEDENDDDNWNVVAIVEDGYTVSEASAGWARGEGEGVFVYAFDPTFSNAPCATGTTPPPAGTPAWTPAKVTPTASLAVTGAPDMTAWGVGAAAAMLAGMSLLGFRRFARR